ncbi:Por secretion system C-terminal sorting domain-containing protein [Pustulibacterium marinum]|uniref:Por secretion system C-terminal sorting domain-containing protein n=1 Tax=Pustulibacterium marinum TaxID=1224947 RepID=A0A1I7EUP8_9FLAO|nr:choice-of-anchor J domain-containing protein [Pustulibacterium marinum]SFU27654.1 Por secretion system C-terminal sorting domain-containing protein [Pustulibacterium marinum]
MKKNYFRLGSKSFKSFFFLGSACVLTAFTPANDGVNPQPFFDAEDFVEFTVSGFNEDVIINGMGDFSLSTTSDVDGTGYCLLEIGTQVSESSTGTTYGLPTDGILTSSSIDDLTFQLADYSENNVLRIGDAGETGETSLTFAETGSYEALYFAVTGGGGATTFSGTVDFEDGSTQSFSSLVAEDWYQSGDVIIAGLGRGNRNDNGLQNFSNGPKIFQLNVTIDAANEGKTVTGVTIQKDSGGYLNLFAVSGKLAADCQSPASLVQDDVSAFDATFSWEGYAEGDTFEVAIVETGAEEPTTGTTVTEETYTFTELTPETTYDVYVRTICSVSGYSYWESTSFTTPCEAVTMIDENFDDYNNGDFPNCWSSINVSGSDVWSVYDYSYYANSGTKSMRLYGYSAQQDYLISSGLIVEEHSNDIFSFYSRRGSSYYDANFDVLVSTTGTSEADFTDIIASNVSLATSYTYYEYDLSAYDGQTIYVAIVGNLESAYAGIYVDDVLTYGSDYCSAPTNLAATDITPSTATLSWEDEEGASWEIVVQEQGTGAPTEAGTTVEATIYDATYDAGSLSEFYVRTICADGVNYSPWSGPFTFGGYQPLEVSGGLNADVIANGVGDASESTNASVDTGNYAFVSNDFKATEEASDLSFGLPSNGIFNSASTSGLIYDINDYDQDNVLRMQTTGADNGGTITFSNAEPAEKLFLALTAGSAAGTITGTINFADGTTQAIDASSIPDWYDSSSLPIAISGIGRINVTNNNTENPSGNPRIYELAIDVFDENQSKVISSVTLQKDTADGVINVFAFSIKYSGETAAVAGVHQAAIKVYPNPVQNQLTVSGVTVSGVEVFNMLGQQMSVKLTENVVDMSSLNTGIYLVTIHSSNSTQTIRVIKK